MKRKIVTTFIRFLFRTLTRLDVQGLESIPAQGGVVVTSNHLSLLDGPLVFVFLPRADVTGMVADNYQKNLFFRWIIQTLGVIWVDRDTPDMQALRQALTLLKGGQMLGIAPEGTRSRVGSLLRGRTGAAYLADKGGAQVLPVVVWGTEGAVKKLTRLTRPAVHIHFGRPFLLPPVGRQDREAALERNTDEIMCRLAALLPESYRGVYRDHPLVAKLLAVGYPRQDLPLSLAGEGDPEAI